MSEKEIRIVITAGEEETRIQADVDILGTANLLAVALQQVTSEMIEQSYQMREQINKAFESAEESALGNVMKMMEETEEDSSQKH